MTGSILIVDDEQDLVQTLEYILEREGYAPTSVVTGKEALGELGRDPLPDLVLLDLMLPDTSGIEICKQIRSDEIGRAHV